MCATVTPSGKRLICWSVVLVLVRVSIQEINRSPFVCEASPTSARSRLGVKLLSCLQTTKTQRWTHTDRSQVLYVCVCVCVRLIWESHGCQSIPPSLPSPPVTSRSTWGAFSVKMFRTSFRWFSGWTACFVSEFCNGLWGPFDVLWCVCVCVCVWLFVNDTMLISFLATSIWAWEKKKKKTLFSVLNMTELRHTWGETHKTGNNLSCI